MRELSNHSARFRLNQDNIVLSMDIVLKYFGSEELLLFRNSLEVFFDINV